MKIVTVFFIIFTIIFSGCGEEEVDESTEWAKRDDGFRPHVVRYIDVNDSIHWQYHMEPEDCPGISVDLCDTCTYEKTFQNYVEYYDTKERITGK